MTKKEIFEMAKSFFNAIDLNTIYIKSINKNYTQFLVLCIHNGEILDITTETQQLLKQSVNRQYVCINGGGFCKKAFIKTLINLALQKQIQK